jgi:hypothetical protein
MKGILPKIIPVLALLLTFMPTVHSISFTQYIDHNGNIVTSNIPKSCVSNGLMVCFQYHPVIKSGPVSVSRQPTIIKTSKPKLKSKKLSTTEEPDVKMSSSNICHSKGDRDYGKTKEFSQFSSIDECIDAGGRHPKYKNIPEQETLSINSNRTQSAPY